MENVVWKNNSSCVDVSYGLKPFIRSLVEVSFVIIFFLTISIKCAFRKGTWRLCKKGATCWCGRAKTHSSIFHFFNIFFILFVSLKFDDGWIFDEVSLCLEFCEFLSFSSLDWLNLYPLITKEQFLPDFWSVHLIDFLE